MFFADGSASGWNPSEAGIEIVLLRVVVEVEPLFGGTCSSGGGVVFGDLVSVESVEYYFCHSIEFGVRAHDAVFVGASAVELSGSVPGFCGGETCGVGLQSLLDFEVPVAVFRAVHDSGDGLAEVVGVCAEEVGVYAVLSFFCGVDNCFFDVSPCEVVCVGELF